jgi:hypothetical protein
MFLFEFLFEFESCRKRISFLFLLLINSAFISFVSFIFVKLLLLFSLFVFFILRILFIDNFFFEFNLFAIYNKLINK